MINFQLINFIFDFLPSQAVINSTLNPCPLLRFFEDLSFYFVELQNRPWVHVLKANKLELARCHFNLVGPARGNSSTSRLPVLRL